MTIYDWLVGLIILLPILYIGVAVLAAYANTHRRLSRKGFTLRVVALVAAWMAFFISGPVDIFEGPGRIYAAISLAVLQALPAVVVYWSVSRLRDMSVTNKYKALLVLIPIFGFFYVIYLMCAPGRPSATASQI